MHRITEIKMTENEQWILVYEQWSGHQMYGYIYGAVGHTKKVCSFLISVLISFISFLLLLFCLGGGGGVKDI